MLLPLPAARPRRIVVLVVLALSVAFVVSPTTPAPTAHSAAGAATSWRWPVDPPRSLLRPYIAPATPYSAGHRGIDIAVVSTATTGAPVAGPPVTGPPVYGPADGTVHFAGVVVDRPVLSIRHPGGLISSFEPVSTTLVAGEKIRRGEVVGVLEAGHCSNSCHCSVPCLHFGVRLYGEYVSPLNYLGGIPHSVLLPTRPLE